MGKASAAEAEKTRTKIIEQSLELTLEVGLPKTTLKMIAERCQISPSAINSHFKKKQDIALELAPLYMDIINSHLDFTSPEALYQSWIKAHNSSERFRKAFSHSEQIIPKGHGMQDIAMKTHGEPEEILRSVYLCLGYSVFSNRVIPEGGSDDILHMLTLRNAQQETN